MSTSNQLGKDQDCGLLHTVIIMIFNLSVCIIIILRAVVSLSIALALITLNRLVNHFTRTIENFQVIHSLTI